MQEKHADKKAPSQEKGAEGGNNKSKDFAVPTITMPKGGGAIQGIGEKFQANPVTGSGSLSIPIAISPGRGGFSPQLALSYDSGSGNTAFGLGWDVGLPNITRKTQKGLPQYDGLPKYEDASESDVFILSGAEDLVPVVKPDGTRDAFTDGVYQVVRYRPRIEGLFARIEKWVDDNGKCHWRSVTKENITTIYGQSLNAKIADPRDFGTQPANELKVFSWLIEKTFDDKGNIIVYEYKKEDGVGLTPFIYEKNRNAFNTYSQSYLKRVLYGNMVPHQEGDWLFELVFDYGDHPVDGNGVPIFADSNPWPVRPDIFSTFRSGFDVRTYRLCHRILMFHHFEAELGVKNYLVKATHLEHDLNPIASLVKSVTHTGYQLENGVYRQKSFPPVSFDYTKAKVDHTIYSIHAEDLPNAPEGIGNGYQFLDLEGEGVSGILKQNGTAWYYKRNLGGGNFGAMELVANVPSVAANANVQITDFGGDGLTDVLVQTETLNGYFELNEENEWSNFKPLAHPVNFDLNDPSLRMIDLDGNGIPDILITENDCFVWYPADAREGYKAARRVSKALDEESGPRVVFKEAFQTIFLADMKGDGMTDIVRIRNGEVCYWANLGYGRFSEKITMAHAPHFDYPDQFDPARLRLLDVDGSGTTDLLYLGRDEIRYWLNESGNGWQAQPAITSFPRTTQLHNVAALDLLGNGTSCLVWSSPLPAEANTPIKYIKILGDTKGEGNKPYLLREVNNNMGAITRLRYDASTKFYLEDRKQGKPWITKLPFPAQVLVRQEVQDEIAGNHFVTRYAYHHGYFDKVEREFRGFGMVEQWDTEDYESLSQNSLFEHVGQNWSEQYDLMPPIFTKTWFHNGYWRLGGKITRQYEKEYYNADPDAWSLTDTELPTGLTTEEQREAARACKGRPLRVEVYGLDKTAAEAHPYSVAETKYHIKTIQNKGENRHASFYVCECETLTYHYERNPADPRIAHQSTLEVDEFGNTTRAATIAYPRRSPLHPEQAKLWMTLTEADFINKPNEADFYRIGVPFAQRVLEIDGLPTPPTLPFSKDFLKTNLLDNPVQRKLVGATKTSFYNEDLSGELFFGEIAAHALPYRTYEAAFTPEQLAAAYNFGTAGAFVDANLLTNEGGFLNFENLWWRSSGKAVFEPAKFYQPIEQIDPYGQVYKMGYDAYHLAMLETETSIHGKTIRSQGRINYRTLQPDLLTDPNGNRQELLSDPLGMVIAAAVMGKVGGNDGDSLAGYTWQDAGTNDIRANVLATPHQYLQGATTFFHYDLFAWLLRKQPNHAVSLVRETHGDPASKTQINFAYSDGFGRTIMAKVQAEPGDAMTVQNGQLVTVAANPRWVGNERTVFNNKGNPVKQYEPYFSTTHEYETETALVEYGVTPLLHYDPMGRNIRTDLPDGTFTKVEFTPWEQHTHDQNDTVRESQWYVDRGGPNPNDPEPNVTNNPTNYAKRAAWLAAQHANTPKTEHLDTLGRVFLLVDDNGGHGEYETRFELDILGNQVSVTDAKGRLITRNTFNLAKEMLLTESMDAGWRRSLTNNLGDPIFGWNELGFLTRMMYDALQRIIAVFIKEGTGSEQLVTLSVYGEMLTTPEATNHYGQVYRLYDQSGCRTSEAFDFKGSPLSASMQAAKEYKMTVDWSVLHGLADADTIHLAATPLLETETFTTSLEYDALSRPLKSTAPDGSVTDYCYNEANFLEKTSTRLRGAATPTPFVENIDYDAKGQRIRIRYGNGVSTRYDYDPKTFRLTRLLSTRNNGNEVLQDLQYHYDPVGNITDQQDDAQQTIFFANTMVEPHGSYTYDALYRLVKAEGREQIGQSNNPADPQHDHIVDFSANPNDGQAMRRYRQEYEYDALGNILKVSHHAGTGNTANAWVRAYTYDDPNLLRAGEFTNRLTQTTLLGQTETYNHDAHGNMTAMPHLTGMHWDYADQLKAVDLPNGGKEYYAYAAPNEKGYGERSRKVTHKPGGKICDRLYLGGYEVYREYQGTALELERQTLHIMDDKSRIALVETLTVENQSPVTNHQSLLRFQLSNHLGSATLELDENAALISYEEFCPFGTSSYRAGRSEAEVKAKRYRYVGKERDESTGLDYYGARFYASWLCRFISVDALKDIYPFYTSYQYAGNKPINFIDLDGLEESPYNKTQTNKTDTEKRMDQIMKLSQQIDFSKEISGQDIFDNAEFEKRTQMYSKFDRPLTEVGLKDANWIIDIAISAPRIISVGFKIISSGVKLVGQGVSLASALYDDIAWKTTDIVAKNAPLIKEEAELAWQASKLAWQANKAYIIGEAGISSRLISGGTEATFQVYTSDRTKPFEADYYDIFSAMMFSPALDFLTAPVIDGKPSGVQINSLDSNSTKNQFIGKAYAGYFSMKSSEFMGAFLKSSHIEEGSIIFNSVEVSTSFKGEFIESLIPKALENKPLPLGNQKK